MSIPFLDLRSATNELRPRIDDSIARVLERGVFIGGEDVNAFEREFADYCGATWAVGTGNGLDALTLMLRAFDVGPGDEVIVPSNTYIATWLAVSATGARPVPVEPDIDSYTLECARVEEALTRRTRAVLAVHLYGQSADLVRLAQVCHRRDIWLLADGAQAHGIPLGCAHAAAYSFYPSKNLGALGDGGAVVTNDAAIAQKIRVLGNYGSPKKYVHELRGVNSRLDPLQAAVLRVKLSCLDEWNRRRQNIAQFYGDELAGLDELILPRVAEGRSAVWHLYAVRHRERDRIARELAAQGVETLIHYPQPPHLAAAYRDAGFRSGDFPLAELIATTELSLPLHPHLSKESMETVVKTLRNCCSAAKGAAR